jgi:hypothetical protein
LILVVRASQGAVSRCEVHRPIREGL